MLAAFTGFVLFKKQDESPKFNQIWMKKFLIQWNDFMLVMRIFPVEIELNHLWEFQFIRISEENWQKRCHKAPKKTV